MTQTTGTDGSPDRGWAQTFFGVIARRQTWLNLMYLVLAFPLGLAYFILLVVGLSVSISLVIIVVGIPILLGLILLWRVLGNLERVQGTWVAGARAAVLAPSVGRSSRLLGEDRVPAHGQDHLA